MRNFTFKFTILPSSLGISSFTPTAVIIPRTADENSLCDSPKQKLRPDSNDVRGESWSLPTIQELRAGTWLPNFAQGRHEGDCAPHICSIVEAVVLVYIKFGINCLNEIVIRIQSCNILHQQQRHKNKLSVKQLYRSIWVRIPSNFFSFKFSPVPPGDLYL